MAESSPSNDHRSATKFTRCRTGCLRCRKRRRKCDEKKPRCQNCIDKNFVCHYGLQVTFLTKNSLTVAADELRPPKFDTSTDKTNYNKIQFINEDPLSIETPVIPSADEPISSTRSVSTVVLSNPSLSSPVAEQNNLGDLQTDVIGNNYGLERDNNDIESSNNIYRDSTSIISLWPLDGEPPAALQTPAGQAIFSDTDEFAVRGLLALGSRPDSSHVPVIPPNTASSLEGFELKAKPPLATTSQPGGALESLNYETQNDVINIITGLPTVSPQSVTRISGVVTGAERFQLLQHYRYHVAPWLDICDLRHPFGITALQMAVHSEQLLAALIYLSAECMPRSDGNLRTTELGLCNTSEKPASDGADDDLRLDYTESMLLRTFTMLRFLVSDVSHAWTNMTTMDFTSLKSLIPHAYSLTIDSAIYWMHLRLDIGVALANNISIRTALPKIPIPSLSLLCRTKDMHERVAHYSQVLLWLCAKALVIHHQENVLSKDHLFGDGWLEIFEELDQWHYLRPQEFLPVVELSVGDQVLNPGSQFPMLLFTNGAGAFCNQLYHTAVLLLLECKPRTALLSNPQSPVLSPLWHAQRVCGIALNNDRRECWDPCLLASFLVATRQMTHESQQREIIHGFDRIQDLTGWNVGEYLTQLREDWSFFDGVE